MTASYQYQSVALQHATLRAERAEGRVAQLQRQYNDEIERAERLREQRDQLVQAALAHLGHGNDGSLPDLLTLIEQMGLRP